MFHLPSIQQITAKASATIRRFPWVLIFAILGTFGVIYLVDLSWDQREGHYLIKNFCWIAALSISFFTAVAVAGESRQWKRGTQWLAGSAAVVLLAIYYLSLPEDFEPSGSESFYRYLLFFVASHFLVSFAPYTDMSGDKVRDFWAFNKTLFLRILLTALYVGVLFNGLSIAMYALEVLLEFDIATVRYFQLAIFLNGIFGTWFFLAGVPQPGQLTDDEKAYPKGLRIFVQYVLIPLIVVYIVILYLYMGKILIEWEWPTGWVSYLVLNFSIAGILGLLLLYPIQDEEEHKWIYLYSRIYYYALIPLVVLLMLSIWVRISEYGVTVNRYYVATLAVWLAGLVAYFIISKRKDIRVIPFSLFLVMMSISFGPLSAFSVSERSQVNRLERNLEKHGLLNDNGTVSRAEGEIPFQDRKQISSGINYLLELKGVESVQPFFDQNLNEVLENKDSIQVVSDAEALTDLIGIDYVYDWEMEEDGTSEFTTFNVEKSKESPVPLEGYDHYIGDIGVWYGPMEFETEIDGRALTISFSNETLELRIVYRSTETDLLFDLKPFIETLPATGADRIQYLSADRLTIESESEAGNMKVKLVFNSLGGQWQDDEIINVNMNFGLYFSLEN
jgi:hypothetical protein